MLLLPSYLPPPGQLEGVVPLMDLVVEASVFAAVAVVVSVVAAVAAVDASAAAAAALSVAVLNAAAAVARAALHSSSLAVWGVLEGGLRSNGFRLAECLGLGIGQLSLPSSVGPRLGSCSSSSCLMGSLLLAWGPFWCSGAPRAPGTFPADDVSSVLIALELRRWALRRSLRISALEPSKPVLALLMFGSRACCLILMAS